MLLQSRKVIVLKESILFLYLTSKCLKLKEDSMKKFFEYFPFYQERKRNDYEEILLKRATFKGDVSTRCLTYYER